MEFRISLKGVLLAIAFFAITVALHEAARADGTGQGRAQFSSSQSGSDNAAGQGGTRPRANFLSIPDSVHGFPRGHVH